MSKNRTAIGEIEISIFEWKMGSCRYCRKFKWRTQVLLAPFDTTCVDINAPNLTLRCDFVEPSDHPAFPAAEIQNAIAFSEREIRGICNTYHSIDMRFARS